MDAVGDALDVAEHHRGRREHAQLVGDVHDGEPGLGVALAQPIGADGWAKISPPPPGMESSPASRQGAHDPAESSRSSSPGWVEEVTNSMNSGGLKPCTWMFGKRGLDRREQVEVPGQRQIGVHAALHEDLRAADLRELIDLLEELVVGEGVGIVIVASRRKAQKVHLAVQTLV
jgi:hypothetical protein